jgi:uncharacterized membrane protein
MWLGILPELFRVFWSEWLGVIGICHFKVLPTSVKTVLTWVPTNWTATMIKTAISDAIRAYSIAVTPELSATKFFIDFNI